MSTLACNHAFILINCVVHRIGRTGRCGKTGIATTFINKMCGKCVIVVNYFILCAYARGLASYPGCGRRRKSNLVPTYVCVLTTPAKAGALNTTVILYFPCFLSESVNVH